MTIHNPFEYKPCREWLATIPTKNIKELVIYEPFAGQGNLIESFIATFPEMKDARWVAHDIDSAVSSCCDGLVDILEQDSFESLVEAGTVITNPPYLSKSSASLRGIVADFDGFGDLWEKSVDMCLKSGKWVVAILPESFITRNMFQERLYGVVSLDTELFEDTDFPVCVALWTPEQQEDFKIFNGDEFVGTYEELSSRLRPYEKAEKELKDKYTVKFNISDGKIGLYSADGVRDEVPIRFVLGQDIPSEKVKPSSRTNTRIRISPEFEGISDEEFVWALNEELEQYRIETHDVFLTCYRGRRKNGKYRRKMDWVEARGIVYKTIQRFV